MSKFNKKGDEDMATKMLTDNYTLNKHETLKIINVPIKKIKPTNVQHDFILSKEERIAQARKILDSNR